jgi:hypothetical protein
MSLFIEYYKHIVFLLRVQFLEDFLANDNFPFLYCQVFVDNIDYLKELEEWAKSQLGMAGFRVFSLCDPSMTRKIFCKSQQVTTSKAQNEVCR